MATQKKNSRKLGRNKVKCARYAASKQREKRKVAHVLNSSGKKAALAYAEAHGVKPHLMTLIPRWEKRTLRPILTPPT